jgi:hypothetical protein
VTVSASAADATSTTGSRLFGIATIDYMMNNRSGEQQEEIEALCV